MVQRAKTYKNLHIKATFFEYTVIMYLFIHLFIKIHSTLKLSLPKY